MPWREGSGQNGWVDKRPVTPEVAGSSPVILVCRAPKYCRLEKGIMGKASKTKFELGDVVNVFGMEKVRFLVKDIEGGAATCVWISENGSAGEIVLDACLLDFVESVLIPGHDQFEKANGVGRGVRKGDALIGF